MGFSLHDMVIRAGAELTMWYKNHLEEVYCIEGEGEVEVLPTVRNTRSQREQVGDPRPGVAKQPQAMARNTFGVEQPRTP